VGTIEQAGIELILQLSYLEGHGWLRHMQLLTRFGEIEQACNSERFLDDGQP
jgi:hypothetical protein